MTVEILTMSHISQMERLCNVSLLMSVEVHTRVHTRVKVHTRVHIIKLELGRTHRKWDDYLINKMSETLLEL